jgi:hypothetical protein
MHHVFNSRSRAMAVSVLALALASLVLAACGSSSSSSSATSTTASAAASGAQNGRGGRFTALRECLQKLGITLPKRKPGQAPGGGGGFLGGGTGAGPTLPAGVTRAQYEAAIRKCGGFPAGRFGPGAGNRLASPQFKARLTEFAACMRTAGINVPAPNTSGTGPIFNTKGLDTTSASFRAAETKCAPLLHLGVRAGGPSGEPTQTG